MAKPNSNIPTPSAFPSHSFSLDDSTEGDPASIIRQMAGNSSSVALMQLNETLPNEFNAAWVKINDTSLSLPVRLEEISNLTAKLSAVLLAEGLAPAPNADRSVVMSRLLMYLGSVKDTLLKRREIEQSDDLNPSSPKFQTAFGWFFDLVHKAMDDEGVDDISINNVFSRVSANMHDWEIRLERRLKGLSGRALENVSNPFIEDFISSIKTGSAPPNSEKVD